MTVTRSARGGFALPAAIITLVLLSTLIVGVLFVATEELRAGRSDVADQRALALAEWAAERAIADWDPARNTSLAPGATAVLHAPAVPNGDRVDVVVTRTQPRLLWLVARATARDGRALPARRAIGASLHLVGPTVPAVAALTVGGAVTVSGGVVDGRDPAPTAAHGGLCEDARPSDAAGIIAPDSARVCGTTCGGNAPPGVTGSPPIAIVPPATGTDSARLTPLGTGSVAEIAARATIVLDGGRLAPQPTFFGATCDVASPLNWGDPGGASACAHHFPLVFVRGSAVLAAGSAGQGMLVVSGSLEVEPGARFVGIVVVANDLTVRGAGAEIAGVAFAHDADGVDGSSVADGGAVRFAGCAARVAMLGVARLARTPQRWWSELR
jgi:hypothetical protein